MDIFYYRKLKNLDRLNGKFKLRNYNLIEHSYMVAMLFKHFAKIEDVCYDPQVFDAILHHDIVEVVTADLPYDVKNFSEETKLAWAKIEEELVKDHPQLERYTDTKLVLTPFQFMLFKVCDLLDLWIFLKEESSYGNNSKDVREITQRAEEMIKGKFKSVDKYIETYEN